LAVAGQLAAVPVLISGVGDFSDVQRMDAWHLPCTTADAAAVL
jgi:hypothetical protein